MIYQYYYKRLTLYKIPYTILLAYHAPAGNSIKLWTAMSMNLHIAAIRNDIHLLNLGLTTIHLRKALNAVFSKVKKRGTFLIFAQAKNAFNMNHSAVFTFVTSWVSGLISNYKRVVNEIVNNKRHKATLLPYLRRPQIDAIDNFKQKPRLIASKIYRTKRAAKVARVPSISLSMRDSHIWAHECACLRIPSILLCDTQSEFDKISYPIIANQRSVPVAYLILHLFAEACCMALINEHLFFRAFTGYLRLSLRNTLLETKSRHFKEKHPLRGTIAFFRHFLKTKSRRYTYDYPRHTTLSYLKASYSRITYHPLNADKKHISKGITFIADIHRHAFKLPSTFIPRRSKQKKLLASSILKYLLFQSFKAYQFILMLMGKSINAWYRERVFPRNSKEIKQEVKAHREYIKQEIIDN